ncbi:hypothetical protein J1N35_030476 [Gossypium stocksii]|uniref:Reverse transcriptase domain-containing protein n=1 Tax=Gossypium stocksii TaxID=47602 RepID=A0A9D3V108_9ROSI|nr:hypothetical protein J1N35_030476 [Gossypium stocksii]
MKALKAPGLDGIQLLFFQKYWDMVSKTLLSVVQEAFTTSCFDDSVLKVMLLLIPKTTTTDRISLFRPISLFNSSYKVLWKTIVGRLRPILQWICQRVSYLCCIQFDTLPGPQLYFHSERSGLSHHPFTHLINKR